jgi:hypothetical protein
MLCKVHHIYRSRTEEIAEKFLKEKRSLLGFGGKEIPAGFWRKGDYRNGYFP